jgi:SAM-dependent methyltransferase
VTDCPVATDYTCQFVRDCLPKGARSILEVGCGNGEVAACLSAGGLDVVALDSDAGCVAVARKRGVDARVASWPAEVDGQFDAVLFTRSLHHISPLDGAAEAAAAALRPGGRLIVEDFRAEGGTEKSKAWFLALAHGLSDDGQLSGVTLDELGAKIGEADHHHEHHLHDSRAIERALAAFGEVQATDAAYYYRYLEPFAADAAALLRLELSAIAAGEIDGLGRRFVVTPDVR